VVIFTTITLISNVDPKQRVWLEELVICGESEPLQKEIPNREPKTPVCCSAVCDVVKGVQGTGRGKRKTTVELSGTAGGCSWNDNGSGALPVHENGDHHRYQLRY
jgi:hypothetical protein